MRHLDEARRIWRDHVPPAGQSDTVEGELIRAIEKLRDEATRNGNGNWDAGHERLLEYLRARLFDPQVFQPDVINQTTENLQMVSDPEAPCTYDDIYDELADRAVEYYRHYGSQSHTHDPELHR